MSAHTPGPWKRSDHDPLFIYALNSDGVNRMSFSVQGGYTNYSKTDKANPRTSYEELEATANLLFAAPELLVALQLVAAQPGFEPDEAYGRMVLTAIAKATGTV